MQNEQHYMQNEERKQRTPEQKRARAEYMREYRIDKKRKQKEINDEWHRVLALIIEEVNPIIEPELCVLLLHLKNRNYLELKEQLIIGSAYPEEKFRMLWHLLLNVECLNFHNHPYADDFVRAYYREPGDDRRIWRGRRIWR
jgi:hypothetical protein